MHGGDNRATEMTSKKKKRHQNQAAVYPVQQVQPQTGGDEDDFEKPAAEFETNSETAPEHSSHASDAPQPPERLRKTSGSVPVLNLMAQNEPAPPPLSSPLKSPHSSCRTFAVRTSPSPSPSTASLPALSDHRRESTPLCRMGSPRQSSRDLVLSYTKGIVTKPQPVSEADVVSSVVELVHEIIPLSSQPTHHRDQPEKIEWVDFQPMQKFGDRTKFMDVLLLGLARGFQIWTITESGNCEEVLSERQGPLRLGKLLPCEPESVEEGAKDKFVDMRPLFALVDSTFTKPETQFCCLSFLSLKSAKIVHKLNFEKPILNIQVSSKWLVIATGSSLVMCDVFTLQERKTIEAAVFPESLQVPFALRGSLLVFGDKKRRSEFLSCGGAADPLETPHSTYTGQMLSAVKSLSRTVTSVGGSSNKDDMKGVVTLVSLDSWNHAEEEFVKLHFVAQEDSISHMDLSPDARLLLTADSSACEFHVFSVLLHTASSTLAAAQHLYVLNRGSTLAKVMSTCFSNDSRWLCLATNHGTVHTFAISPYGGVPTARTHSGRLLNQQSKFARSAGLSSVDGGIIEGRRRRQSGVVHVTREHPSLRCASLARASGNPRIGPFPPPLVLNAVKKIRDRRLNSENLSAWASDLTPTSLTGGSKKTRPDAPKMALAFACRPVNNIKGTSVLVLRSDGVLCEYAIRPCVGQSSDEQIRIDVVPEASWTLYRTKDTADLVTPLSPGSPLMRWLSRDSVERSRADSLRIDPATEWNAQVEDTCSYSAPHRRLWQGPQFHFYCVNEAPEAVQVSAGDCGGTQSIPIVIGDGTYGSHATKVEWCGSAGSERICEKERDEIAKQIADAMSELDLGMSSNQKEAERAEKTSLDDEFFDSADTASTSNEKAGRRGNSDEPLMSFDEDI